MLEDFQRDVVAFLLRILVEDSAETRRRWENAHQQAVGYARAGYLLLARDWTADFVLTVDGDVRVIDTETDNPPEVAGPEHTRMALFRGLRVYPELLSLLPPRPPNAVDCEMCRGSGVVTEPMENLETLQALVCRCGGAGWVIPAVDA